MPSTLAKRVKSRPQPTFRPGCTRVPTWRTRMLPARAIWPAYTLMPRRCPWLSRPFRLLPWPFLCAIAPIRLCGCRGTAELDPGHADDGELLPMPLAPAVVLPPLLLVDEDLLRFLLADDLADHA